VKILQETTEEKWQFTSFAEMRGMARRPEKPEEVILLLHGLGERGKRIFRKLLPYLHQNALILAPDAPFPIPRNKEGRLDYGHSWYFYDKFEKKYFITQDLAKFWLRDLLKMENPEKLPVTMIGFSQGGYLAPLAGVEVPETKLVIGIACEFRTTLITEAPPFPLYAIHGSEDEIVTLQSARNEITLLSEIDIPVELSVVAVKHEINSYMGNIVKTILEKHGKRSL
jgi:predicted esterase